MSLLMIDSYQFGEIVISGRRYESDLIVFPEKIIDNWWRKEGHKVYIEDLNEIVNHEPTPEVLVLGTGYYGLVKIQSEVKTDLKSYGIELIAQPTREACQRFNRLLLSRKRIVGAFHLTC